VIVADTNQFVYLYLHGESTQRAEALLAMDPAWAAPLLWRSEFRNTLIGLVRRGVLSLTDAVQVADDAAQWMAGREYGVVTSHVLSLADRSGCSAYDCEFVALAEDLDVSLVTTDTAVLEAFPGRAVTPAAFLARAT
jgi:predicted nucleic acid-binding protein